MSELKVNKISPRSGTDVTLGDSGDTFTLGSGANIAGLTLSDNILFDTASKGIYLGVTTATASNLLDDYEEGTWTPRVASFTASSTEGYYRKVGSQVTVWFTYTSTTNLSTSFAYDILDLPFAPTHYGGTFGLLKFVTTTLARGLTVSLGSYETTKLRANIFNFNGTTADASYDDTLTGMATFFID